MITKIISGVQTGADRAALDFAISNRIPHGGSCPKGRRAEDGEIPDHYQLHELATTSYLRRTERNVIDSDGTLILTISKTLRGGSKKTAEFAEKHKKPWLHVSAEDPDAAFQMKAFIGRQHMEGLNVAGPSASPRT